MIEKRKAIKSLDRYEWKEFKILHEQFNIIYNKSQQRKPRKRAVGGGRQGVIRLVRK